MKTVISAEGSGLEAAVSASLGRGRYLLLVDADALTVEDLTVIAEDFPGPRFVSAARLAARRGADAVIAGRLGFPAIGMLQVLGIAAYEYRGGSVREAVEALKTGGLERATMPGFAAFGGGPSAEGERETAEEHRHHHHGHGEHLHDRARRWREMWGDWGRRWEEGWAEGPAAARGSERADTQGDLQALRQQAEELRRQLDEVLKRVEQLESR